MSETESPNEAGAPTTTAAEPRANGPEPAAATVRGEAGGGKRGARAWLATLTMFALLLAVLATTVVGFLWWQYREFYVALDAADDETARLIDTLRASNERIDERIDALSTALEANRTRMAAIADSAGALPARVAALEQRVAETQGGAFEAREDWLRAEAEYHLALASSELALAGRWENAIAALEHADATLGQLGNPALGPVREAIADELIELRAVTLPDVEGLAFSLARLAERVGTFPLRNAGVPASSARESFEDVEPGLGRLWLGIKRALAGIIRVERSEQPVDPLLSAEERRLVRKQVEVELMLARIAALEGQSQTFQASLEAAVELLRREFDATTPELEGAIALLEQMRTLEVAPAKPDLSGSLNRLRAIPAGGN
ncbi:MAG TPA: uroporphyrinogen-III C-methyltransferase [Gammaproteobacteria bacterium]